MAERVKFDGINRKPEKPATRKDLKERAERRAQVLK